MKLAYTNKGTAMKKYNLAGKNHCVSPQRERQPKLISLDYNYTKQYNYNNDFSGNHCRSFRGINFHHRASTCGEYPNAIIPHSPKIPFTLNSKDSKPTPISLSFKLYAKAFYQELKKEQDDLKTHSIPAPYNQNKTNIPKNKERIKDVIHQEKNTLKKDSNSFSNNKIETTPLVTNALFLSPLSLHQNPKTKAIL